MPIVSSEIFEDQAQGDGRRHLRYKFVDHLGKEHITPTQIVLAEFDASAAMVTRVSSFDSSLEEREGFDIFDQSDPLTFALNPQHSTTPKILKIMVRRLMAERDPYLVIKMEPVIDYLRATYTAPQIATALNITTQQVTNMNSRINAILNNKADLLAADSLLERI